MTRQSYRTVLVLFMSLLATPLAFAATTAPANALLAPWSGPYGGIPPFDKVRVADFKPALEAGMVQELADVERIANNPAPPSFENTIAALERSGRTLDRVNRIYRTYLSTLNDADVQAVEQEMAPKLAAHADQITQNTRLYTRIAAVYSKRQSSGLTAEQQRLTWVDYTSFVHAGAQLDTASKARLSDYNSSSQACTRRSRRICWPTKPITGWN